jgi:hypothetical protein
MTWNEQVALLASDEYVPNHPAATYALRVVLYIRGKELLRSDEALRTSSGDFHAPAALDATTELVMCTAKADEQDPNLGLAVAFKLPLR